MNGMVWLERILFSALFSGLIGMERQYHGRPAGLRTHMLVGIGSSVITLAGLSIAGGAGAETGRIVAGIVTGIGFLGAGAIIRTSDMIRGLTTAACIWFVAATGIVTGLGLYLIGAVSTVLVLMILTLLALVEDVIPPLVYRDVLVSARGRDPSAVASDCSTILKAAGMRLLDSQIEYSAGEAESRMLFHTRTRRTSGRMEIVKDLSGVEGVGSVTWLRKHEGL